jgi:hypothetical protein
LVKKFHGARYSSLPIAARFAGPHVGANYIKGLSYRPEG